MSISELISKGKLKTTTTAAPVSVTPLIITLDQSLQLRLMPLWRSTAVRLIRLILKKNRGTMFAEGRISV